MSDPLENPVDLFAEVKKAEARIKKDAKRYGDVTRRLFSTADGKAWLALAMARHNFMGSVFSAEDGMSPHGAAYRDGSRAVFSDILNAAAMADAGSRNQPANPEPEEDQ